MHAVLLLYIVYSCQVKEKTTTWTLGYFSAKSAPVLTKIVVHGKQ